MPAGVILVLVLFAAMVVGGFFAQSSSARLASISATVKSGASAEELAAAESDLSRAKNRVTSSGNAVDAESERLRSSRFYCDTYPALIAYEDQTWCDVAAFNATELDARDSELAAAAVGAETSEKDYNRALANSTELNAEQRQAAAAASQASDAAWTSLWIACGVVFLAGVTTVGLFAMGGRQRRSDPE